MKDGAIFTERLSNLERGNKVKKVISLMILLALISTAALTGCSYEKSKVDNSIQTNQKTKQENVVYLMAGKIEVGEKVEIKSMLTAKIVEMNVDIGSTVKKGDPILTLDSKDLQAQVGVNQSELGQAHASLEGAKADYETAKINFDRNNQLFQAGAISKQEFEQSQSKLNAAQTAKNVCEAQLKQAQSITAQSEIQLENGIIVSPISGTVTAKIANVGEVVSSGTPLLTVVNPATLLVNAYLPEDQIGQVKTGQKVLIKIPEIPDKKYEGEITVMDSVVDPSSKTVLVKVNFSNTDAQLKPGMFAEVGIRSEEKAK